MSCTPARALTALCLTAVLAVASFHFQALGNRASAAPPSKKGAEPGKETITKSEAAKPDADGWRSLFDGKTLSGWKRTEYGGQGEVEVKDGAVVIHYNDGCSGITYQKEDFPKQNYEISLEAKRVEGSDFFCGLTFPVGKDPCSLIIGGWGGGLVGLSSIDDNDAANNDTSSVHEFKDGQWYTIRCRVTPKKITAWIDKKQVVDREIEGFKISIRPEVELSKPLGIATWNTTGAVRNIKVRELSKAEQTKLEDEVRRKK